MTDRTRDRLFLSAFLVTAVPATVLLLAYVLVCGDRLLWHWGLSFHDYLLFALVLPLIVAGPGVAIALAVYSVAAGLRGLFLLCWPRKQKPPGADVCTRG